jgi:hypothetical protein
LCSTGLSDNRKKHLTRRYISIAPSVRSLPRLLAHPLTGNKYHGIDHMAETIAEPDFWCRSMTIAVLAILRRASGACSQCSTSVPRGG